MIQRILEGKSSETNVTVYSATEGHGYRIYDSSGNVIASSTIGATGKAVLSGALPVTGYIQGYTNSTYSTALSNQRWPSSGYATISGGNIFEANPSRIGNGLNTIATDAAYYYPTSQYGGTNSQVVATDSHIFVTYRTGAAYSTDGRINIVRIERSSGNIDQGPVQIGNSLDGHEFHAIAMAPNGKLRFICGGYGSNPLVFRETVAANDISTWTATANITSSFTGVVATYKIDSSGNNHMALSDYSGGGLWYGTAANGSTLWTFTRIASPGSGWGALFGDMTLDESVSPLRVAITWGSYNGSLSYDNAYRHIYYLESQTGFTTAKKADGTAVSIPFAFTTNGATTADLVDDGYHYGYWLKLAWWNGKPVILDDGERNSVIDDAVNIVVWNGSSWVQRPIAEMLSNDVASGSGFYTWGVGLTEHNDSLYVYTAYRDADGYVIRRFASADGFQSYSAVEIIPDSYEPLKYAGLEGGYVSSGITWTGGFTYPKVAPTNPDIVAFGAVDYDKASIFLSDNTDRFDVTTSVAPPPVDVSVAPMVIGVITTTPTAVVTSDNTLYYDISGQIVAANDAIHVLLTPVIDGVTITVPDPSLKAQNGQLVSGHWYKRGRPAPTWIRR